jgi:hypothetical protein
MPLAGQAGREMERRNAFEKVWLHNPERELALEGNFFS